MRNLTPSFSACLGCRSKVPSVRMRSYATRTAAALAVACVFAGCGSAANEGAGASGSLGTCAATVLHTLGHVAMHVYHEGIASERTQIAVRGIVASSALRNAVERDD